MLSKTKHGGDDFYNVPSLSSLTGEDGLALHFTPPVAASDTVDTQIVSKRYRVFAGVRFRESENRERTEAERGANQYLQMRISVAILTPMI